MSERKQTLLYRTNTANSTPSVQELGEGELSANINSQSPMLMFKNEKNEIEKFGAMKATTGDSESVTMTQKAITNEFKLPNTYIAVDYPVLDDVQFVPTESGTTLHQSINNIDTNVSKLVTEVINDEEVLAKSFTVLRDTIGLDQNLLIGEAFKGTKLEGCKTLIEALILLSNNMK